MIATRSDYATGLGKGMPTKEAGRSKRQKKRAKMQRRSSFYIRRLPPVAYGSRPPIPEGGYGNLCFWEKPKRIRTPSTAGAPHRHFHGTPARSRFAARGKTL